MHFIYLDIFQETSTYFMSINYELVDNGDLMLDIMTFADWRFV